MDAKYADGRSRPPYTPQPTWLDGRYTPVKITASGPTARPSRPAGASLWEEQGFQLYLQAPCPHPIPTAPALWTAALDYVANLPDSANVDFVAFTDHSNYFDSKNNPNVESALYTTPLW